MRKFLIGIAVVVVVLVGAAIAVPFLVPVEQYKGRIEAEVTRRTPRIPHRRTGIAVAAADTGGRVESGQLCRSAGRPQRGDGRLGKLELELKPLAAAER